MQAFFTAFDMWDVLENAIFFATPPNNRYIIFFVVKMELV